MPRGGLRNPPGGRPAGSVKLIKKNLRKATRFTPEEWKMVQKAVKKYDGRETWFMREAFCRIPEKLERPEVYRSRIHRTVYKVIRFTPGEWAQFEQLVKQYKLKPAILMRLAILHYAAQFIATEEREVRKYA